jgi:hypothetical protein
MEGLAGVSVLAGATGRESYKAARGVQENKPNSAGAEAEVESSDTLLLGL